MGGGGLADEIGSSRRQSHVRGSYFCYFLDLCGLTPPDGGGKRLIRKDYLPSCFSQLLNMTITDKIRKLLDSSPVARIFVTFMGDRG